MQAHRALCRLCLVAATSDPLGIDASFVFDLASIRLELGERDGGQLSGRLYFCAPDIHQASFAGTFEAMIGE